VFEKVLIANRGEIAVRIARTLREHGIRSVAVYSDADRGARHVRAADESWPIGPAASAESYLRADRIVEAARRAGAQAIHPGYGFLSEKPVLAEACAAAGITFIGPPADAMRQMGSKTEARARMTAAGVPVVPGDSAGELEALKTSAAEIGYPIMLKAAGGGGGKGMRLVTRAADLAAAFERARSEAKKAFGDDRVYVEKALERPRHVEIQVLSDGQGTTVHLFERDCSIQRRHQKVVEETPSPARPPVDEMGAVAVRAAEAVGYVGAGTVEFLLDASGHFYFLEMNTRLQVEHPVTELVTGLDLVWEQVRVAAGERLGYGQADVERRGAAIECRIYAEDPAKGFLPSPGTITALVPPGGPGIREDSGVEGSSVVTPYYDPLLSKLCAWGPDRATAIARMRRALHEYVIAGIRTNLSLHRRILDDPEFIEGRYDTGYLERRKDLSAADATLDGAPESAVALAAALVAARRDLAAKPEPKAEAPSAWRSAGRERALRRRP
jgi:acetyl-CoA carboxylase biotin carboxylase subunit